MLNSVDNMAKRVSREVRHMLEIVSSPITSLRGSHSGKQDQPGEQDPSGTPSDVDSRFEALQNQVSHSLDELQKQQMELFRQTNEYVQARMRELADFQASAIEAMIAALPGTPARQTKSQSQPSPGDAGRESLKSKGQPSRHGSGAKTKASSKQAASAAQPETASKRGVRKSKAPGAQSANGQSPASQAGAKKQPRDKPQSNSKPQSNAKKQAVGTER